MMIYTYPIVECLQCGQPVMADLYVRHVKSGCSEAVHQPRPAPPGEEDDELSLCYCCGQADQLCYPHDGDGPGFCRNCLEVLNDYDLMLYYDEFSQPRCDHGPAEWHCGLPECRGAHR